MECEGFEPGTAGSTELWRPPYPPLFGKRFGTSTNIHNQFTNALPTNTRKGQR